MIFPELVEFICTDGVQDVLHRADGVEGLVDEAGCWLVCSLWSASVLWRPSVNLVLFMATDTSCLEKLGAGGSPYVVDHRASALRAKVIFYLPPTALLAGVALS